VAGGAYSDSLLPNGYPPIRVMIVEGRPIVVSLADSTVAAVGVAIGDEVVRVDGEDAATRLARFERLISASTPQSLADKAAVAFMSGPSGTPVQLTLRDHGEQLRQVRLKRSAQDYTTLYHHERSGEIVRILPGNIGYVDLDRLPFEGVDDMFERLKQTRAIIFDMRGYPFTTLWNISPRLTDRQPVAALIETPIIGYGPSGPASASFLQRVPATPPGKWLYRGKTLMLIDERSESQSEHTGLFFRAANGTRFVGSPTAGADGELVTVTLPGGITVGFSGQSIRFPDGHRLQRLGLVPDIVVRPTIAGIRAGRDEALERAIRALEH
jgi:C-terminal processing protease CtpA/Prc